MSDQARILLVDDEPNVLAGLRRNLCFDFDVTTSTRGAEALELIKTEGPFAVVVSDMRMPEMDGAAFLAKARLIAADTVRVLLTGHADFSAALAAVNDGQIFRFLTKPCSAEVLQLAIQAAVDQHRLIHAERELLDKTLRGTVAMLTEIISLVSPKTLRRTRYIRGLVNDLSAELAIADPWAADVAAIMAQVALMTMPPELIERSLEGQALTPEEHDMLARCPGVGERLLAPIPRMDAVRDILRRSAKRFVDDQNDAHETPGVGAQIVKVARDYSELRSQGVSHDEAQASLASRAGFYDPQVLAALSACAQSAPLRKVVKDIPLAEAQPGMQLRANVVSASGLVILASGSELSAPLIERLRNFAAGLGIREPLRVEVNEEL